MYKTFSFKKKLLATLVASSALGLSHIAFAEEVEEVVVTGIKASMQKSMDIKREAVGVVDAISAEDMGKFPDTNLAESLQRITGISISRANGEGAEVTARGFGSQYNMVTLNGRMMPAASVYGGGSGAGGSKGGATRAFDFANLASESVAGVEVTKTGRADVATGGIGAVVNIKTAKPLDNPGFKASVGAKGVKDFSNKTGAAVTPELSGLMSWSDDSGMFGVGLSASHAERDYGSAGVAVNDWNIAKWGDPKAGNDVSAINQKAWGGPKNLYSLVPDIQLSDPKAAVLDGMGKEITAAVPATYKSGATIVNAPTAGQLYARPNDSRLSSSDAQRDRDNMQLTLQYKPADNITATVDYTYANNHITEHRGESTVWFDNNSSTKRVEFDNSVVATPLSITEVSLGGGGKSFEQQYREQNNRLDSVGVDLAWEVSDSFSAKLDAHSSTQESLPAGPGDSGEIAISMAAPVMGTYHTDYSGDVPKQYVDSVLDGMYPKMQQVKDINGKNVYNADGPVMEKVIDPVTKKVVMYQGGKGNLNGVMDKGDLGSAIMRVFYAGQTSTVNQVKLDGAYTFDNGKFDFGVESRSSAVTQRNSQNYMPLGDWGIGFPNDVPTALVKDFDYAGSFEDWSNTDSSPIGFKADARELAAWGARHYAIKDGKVTDYKVGKKDGFDNDNEVREETKAIYGQVAYKFDVGSMPTNTLLGLRVESTDVTGFSDLDKPLYLRWDDNNDFFLQRTGATTKFKETASYSNLLPSLDFDIMLVDGVKARASVSQTIARPGYGDLYPSASGFGAQGTVYNNMGRSASSTNTSLKPLQSTNFDTSIEWYYTDTSYVSAGFFAKSVKNFIGTDQVAEPWFGMKDATAGPRAQAAIAALKDQKMPTDDTHIFVMTAILDNPAIYGDKATAIALYKGKKDQDQTDFEAAVAKAIDIAPAAGDPDMIFVTSKPVNNKDAKIHGAELAVQHFFGESGFGFSANYTMVRGDVDYSVNSDPSTSQFALLGLSDTANLVGIYEKDAFQFRLSYNWRDEYLDQTNVGQSKNPIFVEAHAQIDMNASYNVTDALSFSLEGINLTGENLRTHGRSVNQIFYAEDLSARYQVGVNYKF